MQCFYNRCQKCVSCFSSIPGIFQRNILQNIYLLKQYVKLKYHLVKANIQIFGKHLGNVLNAALYTYIFYVIKENVKQKHIILRWQMFVYNLDNFFK